MVVTGTCRPYASSASGSASLPLGTWSSPDKPHYDYSPDEVARLRLLSYPPAGHGFYCLIYDCIKLRLHNLNEHNNQAGKNDKPFSVRYGRIDVEEHVQLNDLNSDTP